MLLKNGLVLCDDFQFRRRDVRVEKDRIQEVGEDVTPAPGEEARDLKGYWLVPGLIDIHIHGAGGEDYSNADEAGVEKMARYLSSVGTTSFLATSMALPAEELEFTYSMTHGLMKKCEKETSSNARLLGIHMEGPYFSFEKRGAQDENYLSSPDFQEFKEILEASGRAIRVISMAPELPGGLEFIEEMASLGEKGPVVSMGHTVANYQQVKEAISAGARHVTHLYNGMLPFMHRAPGLLGAVSEREEVTCELICDGVHVHEAAVRLTFKLLGRDRVVLVSDGLSPMGCSEEQEPVGGYFCGHRRIYLRGGEVRLEDGTLAGSNTPLLRCVQKAVEFGIPMEWAFQAATLNPAGVLGVSHEYGSILEGKKADLVVLDPQWEPQLVLVDGKEPQPFEGCF